MPVLITENAITKLLQTVKLRENGKQKKMATVHSLLMRRSHLKSKSLLRMILSR
jgi:hypothetical protein